MVLSDVEQQELGSVTQLVFMGMGEPLFNYDALSTTLQLLSQERGFKFSPRRITVSTVGVADKISDLIQDFPQVDSHSACTLPWTRRGKKSCR